MIRTIIALGIKMSASGEMTTPELESTLRKTRETYNMFNNGVTVVFAGAEVVFLFAHNHNTRMTAVIFSQSVPPCPSLTGTI